jgi:hypothetical protein
MSINKKSMAVAAGLILALSATLTSCGGADTAVKTGADAVKGGADAVKTGADTAVKAGGDVVKDGAGAVKAGGEKVTGAALEKTVSPVRAALVQANTAIGKGDMAGAKSQFGKFEMAWTVASPMVKTAAGDKFPLIEAGVDKLKTVMGGASPKKEEASSAITGMLGMLNGLKK